MTSELIRNSPRLYAQEGKDPSKVAVMAKFFTPWSSWTWYLTEYDPATTRAFGFVVGHEPEMGYFMVSELETIRGPGGLTIERDRYFKGKTLKEVMKKHGVQ